MKNRYDFFCETLPVANFRPGTNSPRAHRTHHLKDPQGTYIIVYALRSHTSLFF
jgi:sterol desaturase/sphingolipid hydroxylase (fatty acid hydroxylase superfamily)